MIKNKLKNLCKICSSKRVYAEEYTKTGIPFYRGKEITKLYNHEELKDALFISKKKYLELKQKFGIPSEDDILITAVGTIGSVYQVKSTDEFYFKDGNIIWLKNIQNTVVSPQYLKYVFVSNNFQGILKKSLIGSTQQALTIETFGEIIINLPSLLTQQHIVDTIKRL